MDSIRIDIGEKRVAINDDPSRVIIFNPTDVTFVERFYELLRDFELKQVEYQERFDSLEIEKIDNRGLPARANEYIALLREVCEYMRDQVDRLFGAGASQAAFGDAMTLDMFAQFFEGITPFIQTARSARTEKYAPPKKQPHSKRIMK